jgi:transposase InsO family protein
MGQGLSRDKGLAIAGLSKHQFYKPLCSKKPGRRGSVITRYRDPETEQEQEVDNTQVVEKIVEIKLRPDLSNSYRMITRTLQIEGFYINHKKVYRLMDEHMLLEEPRKRTGRNFVAYGRVIEHKFTHPYTPEENGHVESFHSILGKALDNELFTDLNALEKRLQEFYASYNDDRCHGSIAGLPPAKFSAYCF